jgi:alanine racemase
MDWTFLDVTEVPNVKKGDEVVLIGDDVKAADIAQATGTIAYEITCGITARVPRIFE